jgi:hypothetical protein
MGKRTRKRRQRAQGQAGNPAPQRQEGGGGDDGLGILGLLLVYPFACWGLYHIGGKVWRIATTGSTCPARHCISWDDHPWRIVHEFIAYGGVSLLLAAIVIGGPITLLRGGKFD